MAQALLEAGEDGRLVSSLDVDHPVRIEPGVLDRGRKEVRPRDAPQHQPGGAGDDSCCKQRGGCAVHRARAAAGDLMQSPERESAARKPRVYRVHTERQNGVSDPSAGLDSRNPRS